MLLLCIWSSRYLLKSSLYAFRWEICWSWYIWDFLWPCMNTPVPHFLLSLVAKFVSFYVFSGSYNSPCWLLESWFLKGGSFLWFLPCPQTLVYFSECVLFIIYWSSLLLPHSEACTRASCWVGEWKCGVSTCSTGGAHGPGGGILKWGTPQRLMSRLPAEVLSVVIQSCIHFDSPWCFCPDFPPSLPANHGVPTSIPQVLLKRNKFL